MERSKIIGYKKSEWEILNFRDQNRVLRPEIGRSNNNKIEIGRSNNNKIEIGRSKKKKNVFLKSKLGEIIQISEIKMILKKNNNNLDP